MHRLLSVNIDSLKSWFGGFIGLLLTPENINVYTEVGQGVLSTAVGVVIGNYLLRFIKKVFSKS